MKKIKNTMIAQKASISLNNNSLLPSNEQNSSLNKKDKISMVLGDKVREFQNTLKSKIEQNEQLIIQLQRLSEKSNELISKRNNLLSSINQQKSKIYILKNKNKAFRNYLTELTSKDPSEISKNKKEENVFNAIAEMSENISGNITEINKILDENRNRLKVNQKDFLENIPVNFLKNLGIKDVEHK